MSTENVEIVSAGFEAYNDLGVEGILERFHEDFVMVVPPELSAEPDTYVGQEGARRYFSGFDGSMEEVHLDAEEIIDAGGDLVITRLRLAATGRESGIKVDQESVQVWQIREGKLARVEAFADMDSARAAAGI